MRPLIKRSLGSLLSLVLLAPLAAAQTTTDTPSLTLEGARVAIDAAAAKARADGAGGAIAVVDQGGNLIALDRLDGTFAAGAKISIGKARTAALFQKPTRVFEDIIRAGRTPMIALDDFTPLKGGVPIVVDGRVVGAVGVSGAKSADHDDELAIAAAEAVAARAAGGESMISSGEVTRVPGAQVASAFARGVPLIENEQFKVHASRREAPGQAEVHSGEADIIYVLEGGATFITGGRVENGRATGPDEVRGDSIAGGETHRLGRGDVLVVPAGTPHWFKEIAPGGPMLYYVVKVPLRK
ncbi:MAG: heme-binding protein [Phycisphaerales bacterium]|nr:heme-binding protein [Phycisphaerales bacterium]